MDARCAHRNFVHRVARLACLHTSLAEPDSHTQSGRESLAPRDLEYQWIVAITWSYPTSSYRTGQHGNRTAQAARELFWPMITSVHDTRKIRILVWEGQNHTRKRKLHVNLLITLNKTNDVYKIMNKSMAKKITCRLLAMWHICYKTLCILTSRVLRNACLNKCNRVAFEGMCIWKRVYLIRSTEDQVTTNYLQHCCDSDK